MNKLGVKTPSSQGIRGHFKIYENSATSEASEAILKFDFPSPASEHLV